MNGIHRRGTIQSSLKKLPETEWQQTDNQASFSLPNLPIVPFIVLIQVEASQHRSWQKETHNAVTQSTADQG